MKTKIIYDLKTHILYIYEYNKLVLIQHGANILVYESQVSKCNSEFLKVGRAYRQLSETNKKEMRTLLISP